MQLVFKCIGRRGIIWDIQQDGACEVVGSLVSGLQLVSLWLVPGLFGESA